MHVNPYLNFNGQCRAAFELYERCLGGKIEMLLTYADAPAGEPVSPDSRDKIMHARLVVGDQILMGSDAPAERFERPQGFSVSIGVDDPAAAERIFAALSKEGTVRMPLQQTFWALRFGMLIDRFGIPWMINCEAPA